MGDIGELTLCPGEDKNGNECPQKLKCLRYKQGIDKKKQFHWDFAPFDNEREDKYCGHFLGVDGANVLGQIEHILLSTNGRANKNRKD